MQKINKKRFMNTHENRSPSTIYHNQTKAWIP
jgi:hypothetical protein